MGTEILKIFPVVWILLMEVAPVVPMTWNLALEVAVPPIRISSVIFRGETVPKTRCQVESATVLALTQEGIPADTVKT